MSHQRRTVWLGVGLVAVARVLGDRRLYQLLAAGGIVSMALAQMGWKLLARTVRDLIAWDNARLADLENQENQLRRQPTARAPDGTILEGIVVPARQPGAADRQRRAVVLGVGLVAGARVLRSRRLDEQVIVFIFALAALAQMSRKELARAVMDLIAWDNARLADLQRQLRRQRKARAASLWPANDGQAGPGAAGRGPRHEQLCHE